MQPDERVADALRFVEESDAVRATRITATCAADVAPQEVQWLWRGWLPFGKLVSFDGIPGIGKSTVVTDLIARASRGRAMPYADVRLEPVTTMIAGVEDGWADTVVPRLLAADADMARVQFLTANAGASLTIPRDVAAVGEHALSLGAQWLHLDSIMGTLDENTNAYSDHQVRRALGPLKDLAEKHGLLVTFIRHPRKAGGSAVNAGGGSIAFTALSRVGLYLGLDPQDATEDQNAKRRILTVSKSNLGRLPQSLAFTLVTSPVGPAAVSWQGPSSVSADDLASPIPAITRPPSAERREPRQQERAFLRELLGNGARVAADEVKAQAIARGLSWRTVERAARDEGVSMERAKRFRGGSEWYLPRTDDSLSAPIAPLPPLSPEYENGGANGGNGQPSTGDRVRATLYDGTQMELAADDRDLTELRDFFTKVEPIVTPARTRHAGPGLEEDVPFSNAA